MKKIFLVFLVGLFCLLFSGMTSAKDQVLEDLLLYQKANQELDQKYDRDYDKYVDELVKNIKTDKDRQTVLSELIKPLETAIAKYGSLKIKKPEIKKMIDALRDKSSEQVKNYYLMIKAIEANDGKEYQNIYKQADELGEELMEIEANLSRLGGQKSLSIINFFGFIDPVKGDLVIYRKLERKIYAKHGYFIWIFSRKLQVMEASEESLKILLDFKDVLANVQSQYQTMQLESDNVKLLFKKMDDSLSKMLFGIDEMSDGIRDENKDLIYHGKNSIDQEINNYWNIKEELRELTSKTGADKY